MKVYDSMAKEIIPLNLPKDEVIKVFVCGPTVQDNFHVGHARTYIFFDSLVKYLRVRGYSVFYLQNLRGKINGGLELGIKECIP